MTSDHAGCATLEGLGLAVPPARDQHEIAAACADAWGLGTRERAFLRRVVAGSGIERRHVVGDIRATIAAPTSERMRLFQASAPELARRAAASALADAQRAAIEVTDLVLVTCTGFAAPGVGPALVRLMGLSPHVRHAQVGFMGCFGGIIGMRTAAALAGRCERAVALVVCVELCSLHLRRDTSPDQIVASMLFGDGAAAAVVANGSRRDAYGSVGLGRTMLLEGSEDSMTWSILDDGFAMTLSKGVPASIERAIAGFLREGGGCGVVLHPGGVPVIDAVARAMPHAHPAGIAAARAVLRDHGNMSSGSVLFVLDEYLRRGGALPVELVAFGPGLTIDAVDLR